MRSMSLPDGRILRMWTVYMPFTGEDEQVAVSKKRAAIEGAIRQLREMPEISKEAAEIAKRLVLHYDTDEGTDFRYGRFYMRLDVFRVILSGENFGVKTRSHAALRIFRLEDRDGKVLKFKDHSSRTLHIGTGYILKIDHPRYMQFEGEILLYGVLDDEDFKYFPKLLDWDAIMRVTVFAWERLKITVDDPAPYREAAKLVQKYGLKDIGSIGEGEYGTEILNLAFVEDEAGFRPMIYDYGFIGYMGEEETETQILSILERSSTRSQGVHA